MQIRVAVSKRIGVPKSGSIRASCQCEMELPCEHPEQFLREADHLFGLCQGAVEKQLSRAAAGVPEGSEALDAAAAGTGCRSAPRCR